MKRNDVVDIMKGLAILLMIVGHCRIPDFLRVSIFSFHMPLFLIIGGYYFRVKQVDVLIRTSFHRLIEPYLLVGFLTALIYYLFGFVSEASFRFLGILYGNNGSDVAFVDTPYCGAVWFLLALFWCRMLFYYVYSFTKIWLLLCLIFSLLSSLFGYYIWNPPFGFLIGMSCLSFFATGKYLNLHKIQIFRLFLVKIPKKKFKFLVTGGVILAWLTAISLSRLEIAKFYYHIYPVAFIGACSGTTLLCLFARLIHKRTNICRKFFMYLGKNSLLVLCYHQLSYHLIRIVENNVFVDNYLVILLNIVFSILFVKLHNSTKQIVRND